MEKKQRRKTIDLSCHDKREQIVIKASCSAAEASKYGRLSPKLLRDHGAGEVRTPIEARGVCHSDSGTVEDLFPIEYPRVPRHKVFGWRSLGAIPFTTFHNVCFVGIFAGWHPHAADSARCRAAGFNAKARFGLAQRR
jgi:hypothetical protein